MKSIKSQISAVVLLVFSSTVFALNSGDQVYYLHGPNNSDLSISEGRVISSTNSLVLVRSHKSGQNLRLNSTSLFTTRQDVDAYRDQQDVAHISKSEILGGLAALTLFGIYRAMGEC